MFKRVIVARESQFDIHVGPQVIQELVSHEIIPALAKIDDETGGFRLHAENRAAMLDYMKKQFDVPTWSEGLRENELNLDIGYVIDLMWFIIIKIAQPGEVAKSFAERVLTTIIGKKPVDCCEIHIVADRYDGIMDVLTQMVELFVSKMQVGVMTDEGQTVRYITLKNTFQSKTGKVF